MMVSVIVIFLNAERFLQEAIESVFAQTHSDWELLLVDDGSTDGSSEIAWRYVNRYQEKVRYLTHAGRVNRGMSASRNLGIQHARGKNIAFLDADDVWLPNTLQDQIAILEAHPQAAMVYGPIQYWYGWTGESQDIRHDYVEELGVPGDTLITPPRLLPLFLLNMAAVPSGFLVRHEIIKQLGAFEETFRGEYEDQVFMAKMCLHQTVFASSRCWYRYRQHSNSNVSIGHTTGQTLAARRAFLDWLANYLSGQQVKDRGVWWALRQEYWRYSHPKLFFFLRRNRHHLQPVVRWFSGG